jgi:hypothetical protein
LLEIWGWQGKRMLGELKLARPGSSCVKDPQHFDFAAANAIRDDIWCSSDDEFARPWYPSGTANPSVRFKQVDGSADP